MAFDPREVHYRIVEKPDGSGVTVACVQDFDYPDYTFATRELYDDVTEARYFADRINNRSVFHATMDKLMASTLEEAARELDKGGEGTDRMYADWLRERADKTRKGYL